MSQRNWRPTGASTGRKPPAPAASSRGRRIRGQLLAFAVVIGFALVVYAVWQIIGPKSGPVAAHSTTEAEDLEALPPEPMTPPLSYEGFNPANIISDEQFFDVDAYSLDQIESFIQRWNEGCRTGRDGTPCLAEYVEDTPSFEADQHCNGFTGEAGDTAASIVWKAAQSCGINPQVLLTTMQKEQGLINASGRRLNETRFTIAMGYACPDFSNCDPEFFGFANQVYHAARQFRIYEHRPELFMTAAQREDFIPYAPGDECGGSPVFVENLATSNLYNYTPYQPNEAALTGMGGPCASVGNANFYAYFNAWFKDADIAAQSATPQSTG